MWKASEPTMPRKGQKIGHYAPWEERYRQLLAFKKKHGHCLVPKGYPENPQLSQWVCNQRQFFRKGMLQAGRLNLLRKVGFSFNKHDNSFDTRYEELCRFKKKTGHLNVTRSQNPGLSAWLSRIRYGTVKLNSARKQKLAHIGFDMDNLYERIFKNRYRQLLEYKKRFGSCNGIHAAREYKDLAQWCTETRKKRERLPQEKTRKLDAVGFDWEPLETQWRKMYGKLVRYKIKHGNCLVPEQNKKHKQLGTWVHTQRSKRKNMPVEQKEMLDRLGFDWNPIETQWQKNYQELIAFREEFGHCYVPAHSPVYPSLSNWVRHQRYALRKMSNQRKKLLFGIGFIWSGLTKTQFIKLIRKLPRQQRFNNLHFLGYKFQ